MAIEGMEERSPPGLGSGEEEDTRAGMDLAMTRSPTIPGLRSG